LQQLEIALDLLDDLGPAHLDHDLRSVGQRRCVRLPDRRRCERRVVERREILGQRPPELILYHAAGEAWRERGSGVLQLGEFLQILSGSRSLRVEST
jgi:hypothetical protein